MGILRSAEVNVDQKFKIDFEVLVVFKCAPIEEFSFYQPEARGDRPPPRHLFRLDSARLSYS
jgi:hypothetical protein